MSLLRPCSVDKKVGGLAALLWLGLPLPEAARTLLYAFHDDRLVRRRAGPAVRIAAWLEAWRAAGARITRRRQGTADGLVDGLRLGQHHLTFHSCTPAEASGCIFSSIRSAVVFTRVNMTLFHASFATPNGPVVSTGFHVSPSL